ncbi:hypothetical protein KC345_g7334 [Hortaea werneckii]|nr:hypothetical protein KC345_g7334 [Hortaea werneckii]
MSDDFRPFTLYNIESVEADLELLVKDQLVCDDVEEDTWKVQSFIGTRPEDIIHFQKGRKDVNQRFFLIADRHDIEIEGLLVVNLDFQGVPDAARMKAHEAYYAVPSLNIDNTDWQDDVKTAAALPNNHRKAFAVLVDPNLNSRRNVTHIVEKIHQGVQSSHGETATVLAEWEGVDADKMEGFV